jgi:hypothetical protein
MPSSLSRRDHNQNNVSRNLNRGSIAFRKKESSDSFSAYHDESDSALKVFHQPVLKNNGKFGGAHMCLSGLMPLDIVKAVTVIEMAIVVQPWWLRNSVHKCPFSDSQMTLLNALSALAFFASSNRCQRTNQRRKEKAPVSRTLHVEILKPEALAWI